MVSWKPFILKRRQNRKPGLPKSKRPMLENRGCSIAHPTPQKWTNPQRSKADCRLKKEGGAFDFGFLYSLWLSCMQKIHLKVPAPSRWKQFCPATNGRLTSIPALNWWLCRKVFIFNVKKWEVWNVILCKNGQFRCCLMFQEMEVLPLGNPLKAGACLEIAIGSSQLHNFSQIPNFKNTLLSPLSPINT